MPKQADPVPAEADGKWMDRIPAHPLVVAEFYAEKADELAVKLKRLGSFDRALSTLPVLLLAFGIVVFAGAIVLHIYVSLFGSSEFDAMTLLAGVLVAVSAATYIAEIRLRDASYLEQQVQEFARQALASAANPPDGAGQNGAGETRTTASEGTLAEGAEAVNQAAAPEPANNQNAQAQTRTK